MKNIIVIGMPGVGKSTIGVIIAKILGWDFIDSDIAIQKQEGKTLEHLIEEHGIEGFLSIENQVNRDFNVTQTVISTGGSACYCDEALTHMRENGVILYLQVDYETISKRLGDLQKRGVVVRNGSTLYDLYCERRPLYEKYADLTVNVEGCGLEEAVDKVKDAIMTCDKLYEK